RRVADRTLERDLACALLDGEPEGAADHEYGHEPDVGSEEGEKDAEVAELACPGGEIRPPTIRSDEHLKRVLRGHRADALQHSRLVNAVLEDDARHDRALRCRSQLLDGRLGEEHGYLSWQRVTCRRR